MPRQDFSQVTWNDATIDDCRKIIRLAIREDLGRTYDLTTAALVSRDAIGSTQIVSREHGVVAGLLAAQLALTEMNASTQWTALSNDGDTIEPGQALAEISGNTRDVLTAERLLLNLIGRLSGIATLTERYVNQVSSSEARVYDTRKTTPGWRRLEKYSVCCGGGHNHRTGLFDAILIKDNHLAYAKRSVGEAIQEAREFMAQQSDDHGVTLIEVEVETMEQLDDALAARPDIILLDNMTLDDLRRSVSRRDEIATEIELEASGGISLETVTEIAECGVDRISVGALTHSAVSLDVGLDWSD